MLEERCLALLQGTVPDAVTFGAAAEADTVGCCRLLLDSLDSLDLI